MNDLFGLAGSKPKLITVITSGTGTYIPTVDNARCLIRRQGGGGGGGGGSGGSPAGGGGGGGAFVETMERVPIAGITYSIGAKGVGGTSANGTNGGATRVGNVIAPGGKAGIGNSTGTVTGGRGAMLITGDVSTGEFGLLNGVSGGAAGSGGTGRTGWAPGFSVPDTTVSGNGQATGAGNTSGGGDSLLGKGGNGIILGGANATGKGAGGGGTATAGVKGGDGADGYAEIWDYGE